MSIRIKTFVVCNNCGVEFEGHRTDVGSPQKTKARELARDAGWHCTVEGGKGKVRNIRCHAGKKLDFCPKCKERMVKNGN